MQPVLGNSLPLQDLKRFKSYSPVRTATNFNFLPSTAWGWKEKTEQGRHWSWVWSKVNQPGGWGESLPHREGCDSLVPAGVLASRGRRLSLKVSQPVDSIITNSAREKEGKGQSRSGIEEVQGARGMGEVSVRVTHRQSLWCHLH